MPCIIQFFIIQWLATGSQQVEPVFSCWPLGAIIKQPQAQQWKLSSKQTVLQETYSIQFLLLSSTSYIVLFCLTLLPSTVSICLLLDAVRLDAEQGLIQLNSPCPIELLYYLTAFSSANDTRQPVPAEKVTVFTHAMML